MNETDTHPDRRSPRGGIRLWPMLRRRWWLLAIATVAVVLAAYAVVNAQSDSYTARALTLVPAGSTSDAPGSATDAEQLAATYAALIPQDDELKNAVGRELGLSPQQVEKSIGVVNTSDTALLELRFTDDDPQQALAGARALAEDAADGASPNIPRRTLNVARLPTDATSDSPGQGSSSLLLGLLLGVFAGGIAMAFAERADSRADDPADAEDTLGLPATRLTNRTLGSQVALTERWRSIASREPAHVAFVPATGAGERVADAAATALAAAARERGARVSVRPAGEHVREPVPIGSADPIPGDTAELDVAITPTARPGGEPSGEAVGISSDVVVLVVRTGDRLRAARERLNALQGLGIEVERILFVPRSLAVPDEA